MNVYKLLLLLRDTLNHNCIQIIIIRFEYFQS